MIHSEELSNDSNECVTGLETRHTLSQTDATPQEDIKRSEILLATTLIRDNFGNFVS